MIIIIRTLKEGVAMGDMKNMFAEMKYYTNLFTAKKYKKATEEFCAEYMPIFKKYLDSIDEYQGETTDAVNKAAVDFVEAAKEALAKKGKLPNKRKIMPVNIYMVSYVLPGIVESGREHAVDFAESVARVWGEAFNCTTLGCSTYTEINKGFNSTFLGMPVPRKE